MNITGITHPEYDVNSLDWFKYRLAYGGGRHFIQNYLKRLSSRETQADFDERLFVTYCPAFAKTGINEVRDSIYDRMIDITRAGGSASYHQAISGKDTGVDLFGSSMNYFMGVKVLPELLSMGRVGIYVDMPQLRGESIASNVGLRPYIYIFPIEDIRCWVYDESEDPNDFISVLLREKVNVYDPETGMPTGMVDRYRRIWKDESGVNVAFHDDNGDMIDQFGEPSDPVPLALSKIPFLIVDIGQSLMSDIADYQISLLNLASTDMSYAMKSNFPFYVEQEDADRYIPPGPDTTSATTAKTKELNVGVTKGRTYSGTQAPSFIHPSPDPLKASMEKQEQLKQEIRLLLKLAISSLKPPAMASAESKKQDFRSLESGLSFIGLTLENAERKIAEFWSMYEGTSQATISYPVDYSLQSEEERRKESTYLTETIKTVSSETFAKESQKRIAKISLGTKLATEVNVKIEKEIDAATVLIKDPEIIKDLNQAGIISGELSAKTLGLPPGDFEKAQQEHADRLQRIAESQAAGQARGVDIPAGSPEAKTDKQGPAKDGSAIKKVRGKGK